MLKQAVGKQMGSAVSWIQADTSRFPLADQTFDGVVCANSFHYFRQPLTVLREMRRVLRPGGWLALVDWCDDYVTCKLCSRWLRWTDPAFFRAYTIQACEHMLSSAGFAVAESERFRVGWLWGMMRFICYRAADSKGP